MCKRISNGCYTRLWKDEIRDVQEGWIEVTMADRACMAGRLQHLAQPDIQYLRKSGSFVAGRQLLDYWHYSHVSFLGHPSGIHPGFQSLSKYIIASMLVEVWCVIQMGDGQISTCEDHASARHLSLSHGFLILDRPWPTSTHPRSAGQSNSPCPKSLIPWHLDNHESTIAHPLRLTSRILRVMLAGIATASFHALTLLRMLVLVICKRTLHISLSRLHSP